MRRAELVIVFAGTAVACGLAFAVGRLTVPPGDVAPDLAPTAAVVEGSAPEASSEADGNSAAVNAPRRKTPRESSDNGGAPDVEALLRRLAGDLVTPEALVEVRRRARVNEAKHREAAIAARARELRAAQSAAVAAARSVAQELRDEQAFLADQARGGTMSMLRKLENSDVRPFALVGSSVDFARHFERAIDGPEVNGPEWTLEDGLADGATLRFPAGYHQWRSSQFRPEGEEFPTDLLVVGEGLDTTMLQIYEISTESEVRSLTFRDLTLDCGDNSLTDLRSSHPATIRLERCRVVGFGRGYAMLAANKAAFFASDTRFEAGIGSERTSPSGDLFRVRNGLLARLERCVFVGPFSRIHSRGDDATHVFSECVFDAFTTHWSKPPDLDRPPEGVRFVDCRIASSSAGEIAARQATWLLSIAAADGTRDGVRGALKRMREGLGALAKVGAALTTLKQMEAPGIVVDGVGGKLEDATADAVDLVFPAGSFELDSARTLGQFGGRLAIRGQGMNATLLRVMSSLRAPVLVVRDATIDLGRRTLLPGGESIIARFERCRFVGWDGGSTAFDARRSALLVFEDCRFDGGFGHSPGRGTVTYLHQQAGARFSRCTFDLHGSTLQGYSGKNLVLEDCVVTGLSAMDRLRNEKDGATLARTTVNTLPKGSRPPERRPLSDLNASWPDRR